jgi:hypothetical protein
MTIKELIDLFVPYDLFNRGYYVWKDEGIVFVTEDSEEKKDNRVDYIYLYLNDFKKDDGESEARKHKLFKKEDLFLFEGVPANKDTIIKGLLERSLFTIWDFGFREGYYSKMYRCSKKKILLYRIEYRKD